MQKVVGSNPISRLRGVGQPSGASLGALAEWLRSGLQSRVRRFDSGRRLFDGALRRRSSCLSMNWLAGGPGTRLGAPGFAGGGGTRSCTGVLSLRSPTARLASRAQDTPRAPPSGVTAET